MLLVIFILTTAPPVNDMDISLPTAGARPKDAASKANYVTVDNSGNVYVSDERNHTIRNGIPDYGQPISYGQPTSVAVNRDSNAVLTVSATGVAGTAYQWLHAGTNLPGATGTNFSLASAQKADGGNYSVVITNIYGSATSSVAALTVNLPYTWITFAGLATNSGSADGIGSAARFNSPEGIAMDGSNNVYVADYSNHTIRKITPAQTLAPRS